MLLVPPAAEGKPLDTQAALRALASMLIAFVAKGATKGEGLLVPLP